MTYDLSYEERNLLAIYGAQASSKEEMVLSLQEVQKHLEAGETELHTLCESAIDKLQGMSDEAYKELDLVPDFSR